MAVGFRDVGRWLRRWFGGAWQETFGPPKFREVSGGTIFTIADDGIRFREVSGRTVFEVT